MVGAQQGFIGRLHIAAEDVLDYLIPLVHRLLDQWITGQCADDIQPRHVGLVAWRYCWHRRRVLTRKHDAAGFHESAWGAGAKACDDTINQNLGATALGLQRHTSSLAAHRQRLDQLGSGVVVTLDGALFDCLQNAAQVALFGTGKFVATINHNDRILFGQRDRIFDGGVAGADHDNGFARVCIGIIELILHKGQVFAGDTDLTQVPLQADAEHHPFCFKYAAIAASDREVFSKLLNFRDFVSKLDVDA